MNRSLAPLVALLCRRSTIFRIGAIIGVLLFVGCASPSSGLHRFEFSRPEMGVPFRIVLYAPDASSAESAAEAAFARIAALNDRLSDYEYDSELSALSRSSGSGTNVAVGPELWLILDRSQRLAEASRGAFDVTVGPMTALWRQVRRERRLPALERMAEIRDRVGYRSLRLDPVRKTARLEKPSMRLDLGGIAKGYAADEALAVLQHRGIDRALVAAAGDIAVGVAPPGRRGWSISVGSTNVAASASRGSLEVSRCGVSTSGDLFQFVEIDGVRYSHIVDPRTGLGLTNHSLVTVVAPDGVTADSLATTISVLGPAKGLAFAQANRGVDCEIVSLENGHFTRHTTPRFDRLPRAKTGDNEAK